LHRERAAESTKWRSGDALRDRASGAQTGPPHGTGRVLRPPALSSGCVGRTGERGGARIAEGGDGLARDESGRGAPVHPRGLLRV